MTLTPDEARGALADIDQISRRMRNTLAASSLAPNLMVWGIIWALGFVLSHLLPTHTSAIWGSLCSVGGLTTLATVVAEHRRQTVISAEEKRLGVKLLIFWLTIFAYATGMLYLRFPEDGRDVVVVFACAAMMGYILMGLWLSTLLLIVTGLVVTAATLVGRLLLPAEWFLIWMAIFGGGGLFVPGLYVQLRWR